MHIEDALKDYFKKFDPDIINDPGYDLASYIILQIVDHITGNKDQTSDVTELLVRYAHKDGLHVKFEKRFLENFCKRLQSIKIPDNVYSHLSQTNSMFKNVMRIIAGDFLYLLQTEYRVYTYCLDPDEIKALKKVQSYLDSFGMLPLAGSYYVFKSVFTYVLLHKDLLPDVSLLDEKMHTLALNNFLKQIYSENFMKIASLKSISLVRSSLRYGTVYYNKQMNTDYTYYDLVYKFAETTQI